MGETRKLSKEATRDLLASMRGKPPRTERRQAAWSPDAISFETLPVLVRARREQTLARTLGLQDPYYRVHEARAGATSVIAAETVLNFASYDYLGLNGHPRIVAAVAQAAAEWGTSVSASRLTAGERPFHQELEQRLAAIYGVEAALVFVGGHATNVGVIGDLMSAGDLVVHDALVHNSCLLGAVLSGAERRAFPHNELEQLEGLLERERHRYRRVMIVTEGVFSMDGDGPDLARLVDIKTRFGAWLMVDEAHSLGVVGRTGRGLAEHQGVEATAVDIWMGTLSKTTVSCGGYIAGSRSLIDAMRFGCGAQIYSVGISGPAAVAAMTALDLMLAEPERVERLQANGQTFLEEARRQGLDTGTSWGHGIVPVVVGDSLSTILLAQRLLERGINAFPVLPPGVPEKSARLRFFVCSEHSAEQIRWAVGTTREELAKLKRDRISILGAPSLAPSLGSGAGPD